MPTDVSTTGGSTSEPSPRPVPAAGLTRAQRAAIAFLVVLAVAVAVGVAATSDTDGGAPWPPAGDSACDVVEIFTGRPGSPYNQFARVLRDRLEDSPEGWDVDIIETDGSAENIYSLERAGSRLCRLALAQLTTTVDAASGVNQFDPNRGGHAVDGLRTIGPIHHDLTHVLVRAEEAAGAEPLAGDSTEIIEFADLCGRTLAPGPPGSGTRQISDVLLRVGLPAGCQHEIDDSSIEEGLRRLVARRVDAVFWAGGAGTRQISDAIAAGAKLRALDLEGLRENVAADWDVFYRAHGTFYPGAVFPKGRIEAGDYPGVPAADTISLPNAILAHVDTDPALVRRVVAELYTDRVEFEATLWGDNPSGRVIPDALSVYEFPFFCFVPLHPAAAEYYLREFQRLPACGES